ncbi:hypothetical protein C0Q70_17824 [Pomacea canaliculata]|uniref:RING-type E3 ubiquitin transferase n=1 Tax=Pomacea canaliculata TaxID=400727 RepID=A0A2T7NLI3_POMCA|nr:hypothetical protein C0Q70_17824 [Pomacea canaliculata]
MAPTHKRECALCTEEFATPKILPCGHLLCRQCIISWMDSKPDAGCPLCRCPIVEQSDGSSSATVDALPTDFVMEALVESARVLSKDHLCCVCEDVRADFICLQCQDMMCPACTKAHKKFSGTRSHDVESVSTVTPERLAASRPALCADHGDKHAEYYCFKHRLAVCSACKANKHNVCPEVNYLDNEIDSAQNLLNDLTKILVEAEQKLEQAIGQVTSRLQEVDVSEQEDLAQVDKTCDRLYKMVEDFRNNLKEKTRTSHLKIRNSLRDVKTDLSNRLGKMTSHKHIVTRATSVSPRPALIHMTLTLALTYRINSLDLSTYLQRELWEKPLSSVECCKKLVRRIQQELLMLEQQWTVAEVFSTIGDSLRRLQGGSRVGVLVDSFNDFHLYLDGQDQGIVATDIPPPWFAVFDICGSITKLSTSTYTSLLTREFPVEENDGSKSHLTQSSEEKVSKLYSVTSLDVTTATNTPGVMAEPHERECAVCTNDFTTPKILPCGHLLCRECVISWMDSKPDAGCPLCRCPIVEQSDGSSSDTVDALPTDFVMEALVESARVLSKDHLCCVCEDVRADFICMQCQDMLCSACLKVHKKLPMSRSHDVESVSTVTPERLAASRPALCADHGDKQAKYFCHEHRLAVCSACKSNKHKVCPETNYLDNEIELAQKSLNDLTKILVEAEQKLEQAIGQLTSRLQEVDVSEQEDMAEVDKSCDRLYKLVEDLCKNLKENTWTSHLKIRNSLRDVKTDLSNCLGKVTSHKHIVTRAVAVSPRPALIHMTQDLKDRVNSLEISADLQRRLWVKPLSSAEGFTNVVSRIQQELLMLEEQWTETEVPSKIGERLKKLQVRSRVGVLVDSSNDLHLYVDGQDQGIVAKRVPPPYFPVFSLYDAVTKIYDTFKIQVSKTGRKALSDVDSLNIVTPDNYGDWCQQ